ncbi:protein PET100 homolog, mitochondrial [Ixodes scapularis]|uniref:Protein PET100 homolog, mitochondrial n=1 Tax=Ixodes scapularis TaxID=6945 RepID=B7Q397_IXOSC|nr:protein PET100 homolog, mitochondrial [Ixodes scapularis]EEC13319.1 conserved hypothetical protein [Ixodes scapularis]|eukprot:XP_002411195.1 conserved hypothetical protein [Ixodes scapularis]
MGNWQLEVFKMAMYISFPVGLFYVFNQPQFFEEWVVKTKRECYPPQDMETDREIKAYMETVKAKRKQELLKELESN